MNFDFLLERFRAKLYDQKQENNHHVEYFKECLQIIIRKMFKVPMKQNTFAEVDKIYHRKNTAKRNMSSAMCASSMYSHVCMKMSSFLFVRAWAMPHTSYLSCGIPFTVWTPGIISGLISVVVLLSCGEVIKKKSGIF